MAIFFRSILFWAPVGVLFFFLVTATADANMGDDDWTTFVVTLGLLVIVAPVFARFAALSMTAKQLQASMGHFEKTWKLSIALKTAPLLIAPVFAAVLLVMITAIALEFLGVPETPLVDLLIMLIAPIPFLVTLPVVWAANPYWVDQEVGVMEGLRSGWRLLRNHPKGAVQNLFLLGVLFVAAMIISPAWMFFDVLSKTSFVEAYRVATRGPAGAVADGSDRDSDPNVVTVDQLRRMRGDAAPEEPTA